MRLTIGILFCDKDLSFLKTLLKNIKDKVQISYELILLDNRENFDEDISFLEEYKVLNKNEGNIYQLAGRKKIIEEATGKYIWFIDGDDDVFPITEQFIDIIDKDIDINVFSYLNVDGEKQFWCENEDIVFSGDLLKPECYKISCLWNKWIKAEKLKEIAAIIPTDIRASASEDSFYNLMLLKNCSTLSYHKEYIYTFNSNRSCSSVKDYTNNVNKFKRCIFGLEVTNKLINEHYTKEDFQKLHLNVNKSDCHFFLKKIFKTSDTETQEEMFKIIKEHFTDEEIKEMYNEILETISLTKTEFQQIYNLFKTHYGDNFGYTIIETTYIFKTGEETRIERKPIAPKFINEEEVD